MPRILNGDGSTTAHAPRTREQLASLFYEQPHLREILLHEYQSSTLPKLPDALQELKLVACPNLSLGTLDAKHLRALVVFKCDNFEALPAEMPNLENLVLSELPKFDFRRNHHDGFKPENLPQLRELLIDQCPSLTSIVIGDRLNILELSACRELRDLPSLPETLRELHIARCPVERLPALPKHLRQLRLQQCDALKYLIKVPPTVEMLTFESCPKVCLQIASAAPKSQHACSYVSRINACIQANAYRDSNNRIRR